jgi:hypothetical protein
MNLKTLYGYLDSNRYESLIKLLLYMHHKMPGNAFVAGSESGFAYSETMRRYWRITGT